MKRYGISLLLVISIFLFADSHANALLVPHLEWIRTYDSPSHQSDAGRGVAVDAAGNVYVTGYEYRTDLGEGYNIWLRKYDTNGATLWTKTYDSPAHSADVGYGIAVDNTGNVYATGYELRDDLGQSYNIWLRKYDTNGNTLWSQTYDSPAHSCDPGHGVALDAAGHVYVTGQEYRSDLGQSFNIPLLKYNTDGNFVWKQAYDSPAHDWDNGFGVATDSTGNIYVTGLEARYDLGQADNILVLKYDPEGILLWKHTYNSTLNSYDSGFDVTVDEADNIYVVGKFDNDIWLTKYNTDGDIQWTETYDNPAHGKDWGNAVVVDLKGNVYVTGWENRDDLGQSNNIWLRKYNTNGNALWTKTYDSPAHSDDRGYDVSVDAAGNVYVTGYECRDDLGQGENIILLKYSLSDIERISADTVGTVFNPDVGDGLGRITFSQETPIEIDWDNGMTEVVEGGSIVLWADLFEDTSEDGLASGYFEDGEFAIWGDEGEELLTGEVDWLMMEELFDGMGIMGGAGRLSITGGDLMDSFGTMGEVVDITFNIDPRDIEDFGIAFTGESNITLQPVIPEPASIILAGAALAGIAAFMRRRVGQQRDVGCGMRENR